MSEFAPLVGVFLFFAYLFVPTWYFSGGRSGASTPAGRGKPGLRNCFTGGRRRSPQVEPKAADDAVPPFEIVVQRSRARKSLRKGMCQGQATTRCA